MERDGAASFPFEKTTEGEEEEDDDAALASAGRAPKPLTPPTPPVKDAVAILSSWLLSEEQMDSRFCLSLKVKFSDCKEAAANTAEATVLEMLLKMDEPPPLPAPPPPTPAVSGDEAESPLVVKSVSFCSSLTSPTGVLDSNAAAEDDDVDDDDDADVAARALTTPPTPTPISPIDLLVTTFSILLSGTEPAFAGMVTEDPGLRGS